MPVVMSRAVTMHVFLAGCKMLVSVFVDAEVWLALEYRVTDRCTYGDYDEMICVMDVETGMLFAMFRSSDRVVEAQQTASV